MSRELPTVPTDRQFDRLISPNRGIGAVLSAGSTEVHVGRHAMEKRGWHHEPVRRAILTTASIGAGVVVAGGSALAGLGSYFVRQILTPAPAAQDQTVLAVTADSVTFAASPAASAPGRYSLHWDDFAGHARIGEVIREDADGVTRELLATDYGTLHTGPARIGGYFYPAPDDRDGTALADITYEGPLGTMPGWAAEPDGDGGGTWAILVHGRAAQRAETLRAVPLLRERGFGIVVPSYRNDTDAVPSPDGRYHLGLSEWEDVEAALTYAVQHGARRLILFGWSMGGAIVLQLLAHSAHADRVVGVVLDAPVVSWRQVIDFHAVANHLPLALSHTGQRLIGQSWSKAFGGVSIPLLIPQTDWIARADDLRVPTLLIHSHDDDFVPYGPSEELAKARPDVIRLESWRDALHCREWNVDAVRWESLVGEFVDARADAARADQATWV